LKSRKIVVVGIAAAAIFSISACGGSDENTEAATPTLTPREQACENIKKIAATDVYYKFDEVTLSDPSAPMSEKTEAMKRTMDFSNSKNRTETPLSCTGTNFEKFEDMLATDVDFQDWVAHMVRSAESKSASATPTP
jgi:hypothetical protein